MNVRRLTTIVLAMACVLLAVAPGVALAGEAPPVTPETLTPLKVSANYVEMKVALNPGEAPSNDAIAYKFAYRESPSECLNAGFIEQQSTTSYGTEATTGPREEGIGYITGLLPYRTYTACVIAWNSEHPGEPAIGNPVTFTMNPGFPLTVYLTGQGKVSSYLGSIECSSEECTSNEEGELELAAEETVPGYQFAGWIGCKRVSARTCMIDVTAASEVTAVFLKEGEKGEKGETGANGLTGANGAQGPQGEKGVPGEAGPKGTQGEKGAKGSSGPTGATGPRGPAGPAGKEGAAGKIELARCVQ